MSGDLGCAASAALPLWGTVRPAAVLPEPQLPHLFLHGAGTTACVFSSASMGTLMACPPQGAEVGAPGAKAEGGRVSFLLLYLETAPSNLETLRDHVPAPHAHSLGLDLCLHSHPLPHAA